MSAIYLDSSASTPIAAVPGAAPDGPAFNPRSSAADNAALLGAGARVDARAA